MLLLCASRRVSFAEKEKARHLASSKMDRADAAQYIGVPLLVVLGTIVSVFMYRLSLVRVASSI